MGAVFELFRQDLLRIANAELKGPFQSKAGGSDLVQWTFLEAHRDFHQFHGTTPEEMKAWLVCILRNNVANFLRGYSGTEKRLISRELPLDAVAMPSQQFVDRKEETVSILERRDNEACIEQALAALPEHYRRVLRWRHYEQHGFEEIGRMLERSADAARMLWMRALEQLRRELNRSTEP